MVVNLTFGRRLHLCMTTRRVNAPAVAAVCKITRQGVYKWLNDESVPAADLALKLADYFGVSVAWLIAGEGRMRRPIDLDDDARKMVDIFCKLSDGDKEAVLRHAQSLAGDPPPSHRRPFLVRSRS